MKAIKIDSLILRNKLEQAYKQAHRHTLSGWRIPIFVNDEGVLSTGSWLSQGTFMRIQEQELPIKIESWDIDDVWNEIIDNPSDEDIDLAIQDFIDDEIMQMEVRIIEEEYNIFFI